MIDNLFAVPVYHYTPKYDEIFLVQDEIKRKWSTITSTDPFENPNGWGDGVETNIKQRFNSAEFYKLSNLSQYVDKHVRNYVMSIRASEHKRVFLSHSWFNITRDNTFQDWHQHQDSVISGVYYYQTSGDDGDIVFESPNPYEALELFPSGELVHKYVAYKPAVGKIIIFPGWLRHKVEKNITENPRISFSFNYLYDNTISGQRGYK